MKQIPILLGAICLLLPLSALRADTGENWTKDCAACHGRDGAGHTKAGRQVKVKDLTDAQYQKSFSDADAFKDVKDGLQDKSGTTKMKAFSGKLSDDEIKALIAYVRTLAK